MGILLSQSHVSLGFTADDFSDHVSEEDTSLFTQILQILYAHFSLDLLLAAAH